jgi:hypothetical protein
MAAGDGATRVRVALVIELEVVHGPDPSPQEVKRVVAERFADRRYLIAVDDPNSYADVRFTRLETKGLHVDVTASERMV